jgi:hypothetical protein
MAKVDWSLAEDMADPGGKKIYIRSAKHDTNDQNFPLI